MPPYTVDSCTIEISRSAAFLDTNLLVAYFDEQDSLHEDSVLLIDDYLPNEFSINQYVIPTVVGVETWNMLVRGKRNQHERGLEFLDWVMNPGSATTLVPHDNELFLLSGELCRLKRVDIVDAMVIQLASMFTVTCKLDPAIPIVTDDSDFLKCLDAKHPLFRLFDPRTGEMIP